MLFYKNLIKNIFTDCICDLVRIFAKPKSESMNRKLLLTGVILVTITLTSFSQIREIPQAVRETFANQYPKAENTDFKDFLAKVDVNFELDGQKMVATYTNKGDWRGTEKDPATT